MESSKRLHLVWHLLRDRQGLQAWPVWEEVIVLVPLCFAVLGNGLTGIDLLQGPSFKALISVPTMSPTPVCHHCTDVIDEQGLLTPSMREGLIHAGLVWGPLGRVCRGVVTLAPSHPLPATFYLLKTFAAQQGNFLFSIRK